MTAKDGIVSQIAGEDGRRLAVRLFIDASYEGDLMAFAGVSFTMGQEANNRFGETLNGNHPRNSVKHQSNREVDPYLVLGKLESGPLR